MNVELRTRACGDRVVLALTGELDTTDAMTAAAAVMALAPGGERLIIDLEALDFIDCHAVHALLGVRQADGDVLLAAPHGSVLRLLNLLGVPGVHTSVAAAAESAPAAAGLLSGSQKLALKYPIRMTAVRLAAWCRRAMVTLRAVRADRALG